MLGIPRGVVLAVIDPVTTFQSRWEWRLAYTKVKAGLHRADVEGKATKMKRMFKDWCRWPIHEEQASIGRHLG